MKTFKNGAVKFKSRSAAVAHLLQHTHLSQREIARKVGVSDTCVCLVKQHILGMR